MVKKIDKKDAIYDMLFVYLFKAECPTLRAADAAGAAPDLGAIFWRDGIPTLISIYGGRQQRR